MHWLKTYQDEIEEQLNHLSLASEPAELYDPINYILAIGGKRMRPLLVVLGAELFGVERAAVAKQALAVEVFHNFTLLHDDIMDEAPLRRGQKTVHEKWNQHIAILSGDAMQILAYQLLAEANHKHLASLLKTFSSTALLVCEGQQRDMSFELRDDVSLEEYIRMIKEKTAVLLGAALQIGAICANASEEDQKRLYDFGVNVGLAFQVQDDILDAFADPEKFGKQVGGDILANKKTCLLLLTQQAATADQQEELTAWLNKAEFNPEEKVEAVKALYKSTGGLDATLQLKNDFHQKAISSIQAISVSESAKQKLLELSSYLLDREV